VCLQKGCQLVSSAKKDAGRVVSSVPQSKIACPSCGRAFEPGASRVGINYCRGAALLQFIDAEPGLTAWELSRVSGIGYIDARGLSKLREYDAVITEAEEREAGGFRYHHWTA
jgi:hypothetical protein